MRNISSGMPSIEVISRIVVSLEEFSATSPLGSSVQYEPLLSHTRCAFGHPPVLIAQEQTISPAFSLETAALCFEPLGPTLLGSPF